MSSERYNSKLITSEAKSGGNKMSVRESSEKLPFESYFTKGKKYLPLNDEIVINYIPWDDLYLNSDAGTNHKNFYQKALLGQGSFGAVFKAKLRNRTNNASTDHSSYTSSENAQTEPPASKIDVAVKILFTDKATFKKMKAKAKNELNILKVVQEESIYRAGFIKPYGMATGRLSSQLREFLSRQETNNYSQYLGLVTSLGGIELTEFLRRNRIGDLVKVNIMESIVRAITELHAIRK